VKTHCSTPAQSWESSFSRMLGLILVMIALVWTASSPGFSWPSLTFLCLFSPDGQLSGMYSPAAPSRDPASPMRTHGSMLTYHGSSGREGRLAVRPASLGQGDLIVGEGIIGSLRSRLHGPEEDLRVDHEAVEELLTKIEHERIIIAHTPTLCPARGLFTSRFGWRNSPFDGKLEFHKGIDIAALNASPVYASAEGIVTSYGRCGSLGNVMVISHGHGVTTRYGHLKKPEVRVGKHVKKGDEIALLGDSGRSTGSHLHYEILVQGTHVNPQRYMLK
jgi:hypothetical protein